jgi:uncharacterized protein YjbI with pentapeptide repeats
MTTPNTTAKKVVDVEILHLDETGYGYEGKHTRREWRAECLMYFEEGADAFLAWQESWQAKAIANTNSAKFVVVFHNEKDIKDTSHGLFSSSHTLDFSGHIFEEPIDASGFSFLYATNFAGAHFLGEQFSGESIVRMQNLAVTKFNNAVFSKPVWFTKAKFSTSVEFDNAEFENGVDFNNVHFLEYAHFNDAKFIRGYAHFNHAKFLGRVQFQEAEFKGFTEFTSTHFLEDTKFNAAKFLFPLGVDFNNAQFFGATWFDEAQFSADAQFSLAKFQAQNSFQKVIFSGKSNFENVEFKAVGHFEGAQFLSETPSFRGVGIGNTRLDFSTDTHFPINYWNKESIANAIINIQCLKHLSEQQGQIDQALNFNAMELQAKYLIIPMNTPRLESIFKRFFSSAWWTTYLYDKVSDFGRSYMLPTFAYGVVFVFTLVLAIGIAVWHEPQNCQCKEFLLFSELECDGKPPAINTNNPAAGKDDEKLYLSGVDAAFGYAMYHATGLVDFTGDSKMKEAITLRLYGKPVKSKCAQLFGALLSIINTALLFLIALGLRNSYRLK